MISRLNRHEAKSILASEVEKLGMLSYPELVSRLIGRTETFEVLGASGAQYRVKLQGSWDDDPDRDVRLVACIDDGGLRRFLPMFEVLIRAPDASSARV